ncbi:general secretion pathway protein GspK [Caenimonas sedimenti]|uniref:General secretion pathway protein GspK n=1 Tax=Caenimonas sedimenti TaxID=2596921 RepID=A0A562ZIA4_9BURK|nr:type II secretion system protein GspK [Caenimonas sedimenti]TWO67924.1 general secretion pathway protein GspK [Caenimonas sedimenti]
MRSARGLALVAVLWIVAALSVVAAGVSHSVRQEIRAVSNARQAAVGEAQGQAAIFLVLQDLATQVQKPVRLATLPATWHGVEMAVRVQPLDGLIDLNNAPPGLLALLFQHGGELDRPRAEALAQAAVRYRSTLDGRNRSVGFESPEDLLQVEGIDYNLYAKLAALVTADLRGSGRVNVLAAAPDVLAVLAGGDHAKAAALAARREDGGAGGAGLDTTALPGEFVDLRSVGPRYHLQARVPLSGGAWLLVSRTVDFGAARHGVPWRVLHGDYRFEPASH